MNTLPEEIAEILNQHKTAESARFQEEELARQAKAAETLKAREKTYQSFFYGFQHVFPAYLRPYHAKFEVADKIAESIEYWIGHHRLIFCFDVPGLVPFILVVEHDPQEDSENASLREIHLPSVKVGDDFMPYYSWREWEVVKMNTQEEPLENALLLAREMQEKYTSFVASAPDKALAIEQKRQAELEYQQFQRDEMNQLFDLINEDPVLFHLTKAFAAIQEERSTFTEKLEDHSAYIERQEERIARKIKDLDDGLARTKRELEDERSARYDIEVQLRKQRK